MSSSFPAGVLLVVTCASVLAGCAHGSKSGGASGSHVDGLKATPLEKPILLRLKGDTKRPEKVSYVHKSRSTSYEDTEVRSTKEESLEFTSQSETTKVLADGESLAQTITIVKKDGQANLHDFAMPEVGEKLELVSDTRGKILRAGDYPTSSIFYVPPISLPENPVNVGDTWTLQSRWLSLEESVPYQLDMVSIFKGLWTCGNHRCAELEIGGEVTLQGPVAQTLAFKSLWKGHLMFDVDAGTVLWSRVDSEEQFMAGNVRRAVNSCLEAALVEPTDLKLPAASKAPCASLSNPGDIAPSPGPVN
jgi:hypothetical protein